MSVKEIEHRWLLNAFPDGHSPSPLSSATVKNGYINTENIQERFTRRIYNYHPEYDEGLRLYRRTVKIGHGIERYEFKDKINKKLFKKMWPLTKGSRIRKTRIRVKVGGLIWEVDTFHDRKLFLAEVEVPTIDYEFDMPDWLRHRVVREVTDEPEFEGCNLAK